MPDQISAASRSSIAYYRQMAQEAADKAAAHRARAAAAESQDARAVYQAMAAAEDRDAAHWTALADELETFGREGPAGPAPGEVLL